MKPVIGAISAAVIAFVFKLQLDQPIFYINILCNSVFWAMPKEILRGIKESFIMAAKAAGSIINK